MKTLVNLIGPLSSALLLTLSFPKFDLWFLSFFSLVPLLFSLSFTQKNRDMFIFSFLFGIFHFSTLLYWLVYTLTKYGKLSLPFSIFLLLLLSSYLSLYYILSFYVNFKFHTFKTPNFAKGLFFSITFVGTEYLRSTLLTGFSWGQVGYILSNLSPFLQSAELWGIWGLSFTLVLINYYIFFLFYYLFFSPKFLKNLNFLANNLCFLILVLTIFIYGVYRENFWKDLINKEQKTLKVSLLQGNIPQEMKEKSEIEYSLNIYKNLAFSSLEKKPDLIFFPETSFPFFFPYEKNPTLELLSFLLELNNKAKNLQPIPALIFGTFRLKYQKGTPIVHNSLIVWQGDNLIDFYDKEKLVPFGEYLPLEKYLFFLKRIVVGLGIVKPGTPKNLKLSLEEKTIEIVPLICFESAFSEILRKRLKSSPQLIFIATNDAWFNKTSAPYQHFQVAKVRAVEARKYTIQVANTGISGIIDPTGKVIKKTELEERKVLFGEVKLFYQKTPFVRYGNMLGVIGCGVLLFSILILFLAKPLGLKV